MEAGRAFLFALEALMTITPTELAALAGVVLSLVFSYIPGLKDWYDALTPTPKRGVMLLALLAVALGALAYQCRGDGACYGLNFETVLRAFVMAAIANQATAALTPLSPERRAVREQARERNEPELPDLPRTTKP